ncbi:4-hydroxy-tetrahydrodipicolinate synthase [Sporomusa acidovorans]|uniref:4-hydroxy-tetrahydrodipicolinate synthase n=1 Tax=Sporomusa acidovorans TaxID=112900 RepID=UPI000886DD81|nr:4-hydroxy-tetrahydrodipicolinate synthase [Sporomusa acidovorans]OZC14796.1 4-hydroxy-tetrahydrodipicolinate synthase [Sporomusa acidovorans DSM 3132]SDF70859.1 4-hydroxy-tetrahydrodipicolinate synthase [Sporomusa acidovorans]
MLKPKGIITPIVTPMNDDESINEAELRVQVNRLINSGVYGLFPLGTNGEVYALSLEEKIEVMKIVVDETKGRVPVYAGTGCISTNETIALSKKAQEIGVDALSIVSPYFVAVSQDDLYRHFSKIAEAVSLPIILYNMPARTGNNIEYTTISKLTKYENIVAIKDSSGNFDNTLRYIENTDRRLSVLAGNDSLILWTLLAGGCGAIAGWSNVYPELLISIYKLWEKGNITEANIRQGSIRPLRDIMKLGNPNSVVKRAMNLLGYKVGPAREPASGINPKIDEALLKAFQLYK